MSEEPMSYEIMRDGQVHGPYTANDLRSFASDGRLKVDDQVCAGGTNRWVLAGSVGGLDFGQHSRQPPSEAPQQVAVPEDAAGSQATGSGSKLMETVFGWLGLEVVLHAYRMGLRRFGRLCVYAVAAVVIFLIVVGLVGLLINAMT